MDELPLYVIMGPTASGKSALALALAERLGGEIISADSMQVYRGLDIGTAKPTLAERQRVRHHLIDILDIAEPMDANRFVVLADAAIGEIRHRGRIPVVVGGSGMYLKALLRGLDDLPASDPALRARLEREYGGTEGLARLRSRLAELDPESLNRHATNPRRLLRALEVHLLTGQPMSGQQMREDATLRYPAHAWRLEWPREMLVRRIAERTDEMLAQGWIAEAAALLPRGLLASPTAKQALGYPLIAAHLAGRMDAATLRERLVVATRQYARRQATWFRHQHPEASILAMPVDIEAWLAAAEAPA